MPTHALGISLDRLLTGWEGGAGASDLETFAGEILTNFAGETLEIFT